MDKQQLVEEKLRLEKQIAAINTLLGTETGPSRRPKHLNDVDAYLARVTKVSPTFTASDFKAVLPEEVTAPTLKRLLQKLEDEKKIKLMQKARGRKPSVYRKL